MNRILLFAVLMILFSSFAANACVRRTRGRIKVVNEKNEVIPNARIWEYYAADDSDLVTKHFYLHTVEDTNYYYIYSYGRWYVEDDYDEEESLDYTYRIQAEGFADILIKDISFKSIKWKDTIIPTLIITLYTNKYLKQDNSITLLDHFLVNRVLKVSDSTPFQLKDYFTTTENSTTLTDEAIAKISTYPNPVVKELHVKVNYETREVLYASISDAQGRLLEELQVEGGLAIANLEGYKPGNYYVVVKDAKGVYLHRQLIIKL